MKSKNWYKKKFLIFLSILLHLLRVDGQQDTIRLKNSSFEDYPHRGTYSTSIKNWFDCGAVYFPAETAPDIHPVDFWGNTKQAYDGRTYLGMVTRDNDSYESVSQKLTFPLQKGNCYSFSVYLSKSERYISISRVKEEKVNYTKPAVLRIWGGFGLCDGLELLGESDQINHSQWQKYDFKFTPNNNLHSLTLEAFYKVPVLFPYSGHILVDNLSEIIEVGCEEEIIVSIDDAKNQLPSHKRNSKESGNKINNSGTSVSDDQPHEPKILEKLKSEFLKEGQTIEIKNLYFEADTSSISENSHDVLNEIYVFLTENQEIKIEIGGHTNNIPKHEYCDKLSSDRAKAVAEYIIKKGISPSRLTYKGYGKRKPIANNFTKEGRKKNQRVEIKIISLG